MKRITTRSITTRVASRIAMATALSLGIAAGTVGVASATPVAHDGFFPGHFHERVRGTVSSYVAGTSISLIVDAATAPTTFTLTSSTPIDGLAPGATLASPALVVFGLPNTTPVTVTSIEVRPVRVTPVEAVVSAYSADSSITVMVEGSTTPTTYTLTSATTVSGLMPGATLASPDHVKLVVSPTSPTTVTAIYVEGTGGHPQPGNLGGPLGHHGRGLHRSRGYDRR